MDHLKQARQAVSSGTLTMRAAAAQYGIPKSTLHRRLGNSIEEKNLGRYKTVFSKEEEMLLAQHVKEMDKLFYGMTIESLQKLACDFAEANEIPHPFVKGQAGRGWVHGFMLRHPELSLRTPESTSIARAVGFNRPQVR